MDSASWILQPILFRHSLLRWTALIVVPALLIWWSHALVLKWIARILIVDDALRPACAIVVLAGGPSFRALEAADLYRAGWAPRVIVSGAVTWDRDTLLGAGLPPQAIVRTNGNPRDTLEELQSVSRLVSDHTEPVILVTSKVHTRRTRLIWRHVTGHAASGLVRWARRDPFDASHWWHDRLLANDVVHEYLSLVNYWFGFPVSSRHAVNSGQQCLPEHT